MDVRGSLNAENNLAIVTGEGEKSFVENDSFFAKAPPQAASTVGRTKARRFMQHDSDMGSFLDDLPGRTISPFDIPAMNGARPKVIDPVVGQQAMERNQEEQMGQNIDWSVVNAWCRDNKSEYDKSSQDERSSLGIINVDEMDLSTNNLLLETPLDELRRHDTEKESSTITGSSSLQRNSNSSENSSLRNNTPSDLIPWKHDGSSSNNSQETKPDQPFARSHINTVKRMTANPKPQDPIKAAIRHSLFGQMTIGEEGEEGDTSVYNVELQAEELNEIDNDFGEINLSDNSDDESKTPVAQTVPKMTVSGDEIRLNSVYFRPGVNGEEQTASSLPFLSKVSLFEGGSGSEIDTEDELEQARKEQGARHEAAGEASNRESSRPGLEGDCFDDHTGRKRLPITQRQSAEGDVVSSPVPGDGGGGGDGSSGSESDDGRQSRATNSGRGSSGYASNLPSNRQSQNIEQEEQRIRPMGDDLLSEMRFSKYEASANHDSEDTRLHSRYLARTSPVEDTNPDSVMMEDFFESQNQTGEEEDFFPGNRLEASGFNADDFPVQNFQQNQDTRNNSNLLGQFESSFGSFGLSPGSGSAGQFQGEGQPHFDSGQQIDGVVVQAPNSQGRSLVEEKDKRFSAEQSWTQLIGSTGNSVGSKQNSLGSEPRTCGDIGRSSSLYEQTDYARLGSGERGSLGRSSGSGSPSRSFSGQGMAAQSNASSLSMSGFGANLRKSGSKPELKDSIFKKPFLPAPKAAAVFTKSVAKSKTYQSGSYHSSNGKASGQSSTSSVRSDMSDFKNDLAFRMSLTNEAEEQRIGLKRVPSVGETNTMDLTVNDDDFFDNADALAMLDEDEKQFEEENVFRKDDAMVDTASPGDSWAYKSIMSIARPSWLDDSSNEEKVVVRISVGSYMRGRTEALGSLDGDENVKRPDFGMTFNSPEKANEKPARLIEEDHVFDETRTSGVGQQYADSQNRPSTPRGNEKIVQATPNRIENEDVVDYTLTMDSLMKTPRPYPNVTDAAGLHTDISMDMGNATLTSEVSAFLKRDSDIKTIYTKFMSSVPKSQEIGKKQASECAPVSPSNSSHLPIRKGSTLKQSLQTSDLNQKPTYSTEDISQKSSSKQRTSGFRNDEKSPKKVPFENTEKCVSPKASSQDDIPDVWSSPNISNYHMPDNGLFDRMDEFYFSRNHQNSEKSNPSGQQLQDLKETLKAQYSLARDSSSKVQDREKTPPPDGEDQRPHQIKGVKKNLLTENSKAGNKSNVVETSISRDMSSTLAFPSKTGKINQRNISGMDSRHDVSQNVNDSSRLKNNASDHGYMPGHHIPDGTAYSQRSDYSHMDHKGMSREDVAGVDDVGLAESRGFDMLQRKRDHVLSERKSWDADAREHVARSNDSVLSMKPVQSFESLPKKVTSKTGSMSKTNSMINQCAGADFTSTEVTNTRNDTNKLESWTQTSLVFSQGSEFQQDSFAPLSVNKEAQLDSSSQTDRHFQSFPTDSFNMTDNMKSQHYCTSSILQTEPEKLHLLTRNTSLLKTKFAQDNLKRNFGVEVMDKIYSNKSIPDDIPDFPTQTDDKRWSFQSAADWTHLQGHITMDASHIQLGDIGNLHRGLPSAHSTPMPQTVQGSLPTSQYSMLTAIPTGDSMTQFSILSTTDSHLYKTPGRVTLCPVESPGVLEFKDACCVGISKKEALPLKNPTGRWMECIIQVVSLEIDGQASPMDNFPFELRRKKIIIDPYKMENIDIIFLPKRAGAYVAQVHIFSQAFTKSDDLRRDTIPVNVTFQAIAEEPWIKVQCEEDQGDTLDFGEIEWGSCTEKTISLKNMGHATVPLRLAITSPEGRSSDISIISGRHVQQSGQGRTIVNLSLSGSKEHFDYHTVKVWCRPPEKQCTRMIARQPAEQLYCNLDVEVDIPCCKFPKLASLRMKAMVGVKKLHVHSKQKEIQLSASPNCSAETSIKLLNAGNLNLDVTFCLTEHKSMFTVLPARLQISPGVSDELKVVFKPTEYSSSKFASLLLMMVLPQGPTYELPLQGRVIKKKSVPCILCDCTDLDFGGVAIGKAVVKRYRLLNKGAEPLTLIAEARVDDVKLLLSPAPSSVGSKKVELYLPPGESLSVYPEFSPTQPVPLSGKIVMKPKDDVTKFVVTVLGYGGVSKLSCSDSTSIKGYPCVYFDGTTTLNELYIHNNGAQTASVKLVLYSDLKCSQKLTCGQTVIQPSDFVIEAQQKNVLQLVTSLSQRELAAKCDANGLYAVVKLSYKDVVDSAKPHRSDLIIGIMLKNQPADQVSVTYTPCKSTKRFPQSARVSQPLKETTSYRSTENVNLVSADSGLWNVTPQDLTLYCSKKGSCDRMSKCNIINNSNKDLRFEISWPGDMLSVVPGQGLVKPREKTNVQIFPSSKASNMLDQLPWAGKVAVMSNDVVKIIRVNLRHDSSGDENEPVQEDSRLVPVSMNIPQTGSNSNKLGNLEVSRTKVMFTQTCVGKVSEESLWLKNDGPDMLRWMFSSFASPYLQKNAEKTKEMFRVSYKVFDFSRQFGKLNGHDTVQLTVQFMPRSSGSFSQFWDLHFTGNSGDSNTAHRQDFIRIHFTGEAFEEPESQSKAATVTRDIMQSFSSGTKGLTLCNDKMTFSQTRPESCVKQKVEIRNTYKENVEAEVIAPSPPFYVKHHHFTVEKKRVLRFPVEFRPSRPGQFSDKVKFQSSKGDNLILYLTGECCL